MSRQSNRARQRGVNFKAQEKVMAKIGEMTLKNQKMIDRINSMSVEEKEELEKQSFEYKLQWLKDLIENE